MTRALKNIANKKMAAFLALTQPVANEEIRVYKQIKHNPLWEGLGEKEPWEAAGSIKKGHYGVGRPLQTETMHELSQ